MMVTTQHKLHIYDKFLRPPKFSLDHFTYNTSKTIKESILQKHKDNPKVNYLSTRLRP